MKFIHKSFPAQLHDPLNLKLLTIMPPAAEDLYDDPADSLQVVVVARLVKSVPSHLNLPTDMLYIFGTVSSWAFQKGAL